MTSWGAEGGRRGGPTSRPHLRGLPLRPTIPVVNPPPTSYAWNDGTALAYQVVGASSGPDLLFAPGSVTHLEVLWQEPSVSRFLTRLAGFSRLILMDPRGLGLSDRLTDVPTLDERVADVIAVLDAAESDRAALFGNADTGPPAIATAVSHPERVTSLILCGTYAKARRSDDYPMGWTEEEWTDFERRVRERWGKEADSLRNVAPSRVDDDEFGRWWATLMRLGASPRAVLLLGEMTMAVDVRDLLPRVTAPTLVMHRVGDRVNDIAHGQYLAERIPGARWVELPGEDFALWAGDLTALADEVEEFLTGHRSGLEAMKAVTTVMFTDIVGSTELARNLGDSAWSDLLEKHDALVPRSSAASEARRSIRLVMGSSRRSRRQPPRSVARELWAKLRRTRGSRSASVFTRASATSSAASHAG